MKSFKRKTSISLLLTEQDEFNLIQNLCERSLRDYIKYFWNIVEPETDYVPGWHIDAICDHLEAVSKGQITKLIINIPPRHMKLCSDNTIVPTPQGYKKHGDLKVGDFVFHPSGRPIKVINVSEKDIADCVVKFTNGGQAKVNLGHLWTVRDRISKKWKTVTTEYLLSSTISYCDGGKKRNRFAIPDCDCLEFAEKNLILHPYFLGCWLGDGSSSKACISHDNKDVEHIRKINAIGISTSTVCKNGENCSATYFSHQGIIDKLRSLRVYKNKHIPEIYLQSSKFQRLELLAGLIDTDGHVCFKTSRVRIVTIDKKFANQILRLVNSLGFNGYICKSKVPLYGEYISKHEFVYSVGFQPNMRIPTEIPRKKINRLNAIRRKRYISQVFISKKPEIGNCISVNSFDGLYVIGKKNIVTHNSLTVCVFWPTWAWINNPGMKFLFSSYSEDLSTRDNEKCARLIKSNWYQKKWKDKYHIIQENKTKLENSCMGYRIATSVGGMATGEGGDAIIVDDPHNARDVGSFLKRSSVLQWWDEAMSSRLNDQKTGIKIIIMQRLHEKDLTGHVLAKDLGYEHLCLPHRYEGNNRCKTSLHFVDPRSEVGEELWKEKFPDKQLSDLEKSLGIYATAGQLYQRPAPRGGGVFKKSDFVLIEDINKEYIKETVRYWDKAGTQDGGCYTAGVRIHKLKEGFPYQFVIDSVIRGQWIASEREQNIKQISKLDKVAFPKIRIWIEQEPGSGGKESAESTIKTLAGLPIYAERVSDSKGVRAEPLEAQVQIKNVAVLEREWTEQFLDEMASFNPDVNAGEKDQVDAASGAFNKLYLTTVKRASSW